MPYEVIDLIAVSCAAIGMAGLLLYFIVAPPDQNKASSVFIIAFLVGGAVWLIMKAVETTLRFADILKWYLPIATSTPILGLCLWLWTIGLLFISQSREGRKTIAVPVGFAMIIIATILVLVSA